MGVYKGVVQHSSSHLQANQKYSLQLTNHTQRNGKCLASYHLFLHISSRDSISQKKMFSQGFQRVNLAYLNNA